MSQASATGKSVADKMRNRLDVMMHLGVTALGAKMAEEERPDLEERIKEELPKLTASDVFVVYCIVVELADNRVL